MVKKIFKILLWLILLGSSLILLSFVSGKYDQIVLRKISIDFNANVGFEYRTKKSGFFYLGGSIRVPFSPLFIILTKYQNQGYDLTTIDELNGSYLSIDLKYFFPITRSSGSTFKPGPIE